MNWKSYVISGAVFAVAYAVSHDYFFAGVNGFAVFYWLHMAEQKSEKEHANAEAGG